MGKIVKKRLKGDETKHMVFGILVLVLGTVLFYGFGFWVSQWDSFAPETNFGAIIHQYSGKYFVSLAATVISIIVYIIMFRKIAERSDTQYLTIKIQNGNLPFIYKGWVLAGAIAAVVVGIIALVIHYFAFERHFDLVAPLMWWVIVLQMLVSVSVYFFPFSKPLTKG